jgi:hypothetical protein
LGHFLLPALSVARWTEEDTHLRSRAALQVATAGMLFLLLAPEVAFALRPGRGWAPLLHAPGWCWLQSIPPPVTLLCRHQVQSYAATGTTVSRH